MKKRILAIALAALMVAAVFAIYVTADKAPALRDAEKYDLDAEGRDAQGILYTLDANTNTAVVGKAVYAENNTSGYNGNGTVIIPEVVSAGGVDYVVREIGRNAFDGSDVKEVIVGNNVTRIGEMAFAGCESLERVAMGSGVTDIAGFAFWHCTNLVDAAIGENVKTIGGAAFWSCKSLEVVTIPQNATSIMEKAFLDCDKLTTVYKSAGTTVADDAFGASVLFNENYIPAVYVPTTYASAGETVKVRVLLEGNPGNADLSTLKVNGQARSAADLAVEIGTTAYNGTIFMYDEPVEGDKAITAELSGVSASGALKACAHGNTEEVVAVAATCTEAGVMNTVCADCHEVISSAEIAALNHDYVDFVIEAVCLDGGYTTHKCARCGDTYKDAITPATGHTYDAGTIRSMPTAGSVGSKRFVCENCKRVNNLEIPVIGDVDASGTRNARDVALMMQYAAGWDISNHTFWVESANCDGQLDDGAITITARDIAILMRYLVGDTTAVLTSSSIPTK